MAETKKLFNQKDLSKDEKEQFTFVLDRVETLKKSRQNHYGVNLDKIWADADRDCVPHRLRTKGKKMVVTDEERGWRGALVEMGSTDWQSDISQANPFVKIQTALAILIDQNPSGVFTPANKRFEKTTQIIKQLYQRSWEYAKSKAQLKLFVFNLAKYGFSIGRTYPLRIVRKVKKIKEYNQEEPDKTVYEEKEVEEYNDIFRENIDPRNAWIDDISRPNNSRMTRDWAWRKIYDLDDFKTEFKGYKRAELVNAGGDLSETVSANKRNQKEPETKNLVEVYFYENRVKDLFMVVANGVPVIIEPLPIADSTGLKKLSCWHSYWNLRHAESAYGVGIYEAIRYDQAFLDRIRNMTIDQLTLSIYKMFFFTGTQTLTDTGDIQIRPGVGKQVLNPKDINWLDVPGPGQDAYLGIEMARKDVDEASGITPTLMGDVTGKTAFEIAQAKESALKRLKNPLENIQDALNDEGYVTVALIQLLYSIPETYKIADPALVEEYLQEVQSDPELYERNTSVDEETGIETSDFTAKVFREFPINLDKDEKGNLIETEATSFFRVKPSGLRWEGIINIKSQSLLTPSKQIDKSLELEMYNMLIPLLGTIAQERAMRMQAGLPVGLDDLTNGKTVKNICKLYDKDPKDVLPDEWFEEQEQPMFLDANQGQPGTGLPQPVAPQAETLIPSTSPPQNPQSIVGKVSAGLGNIAKSI